MRRFLVLTGLVALVATPTIGQEALQSRDPAEIIKLLDTDKDTTISKEEWVAAGRREERFARIDADGNGKVTVEELKAAIAAMQGRQPQPTN
jgi:Ca2+-binding EF-hand superfamily protein